MSHKANRLCLVASPRSTEVNLPPKLPSSTDLQPTPATKHKQPYASGLTGALFASFCSLVGVPDNICPLPAGLRKVDRFIFASFADA